MGVTGGGKFVGRFGRFVSHKDIVSLTMNIVVNNTFRGVMGSLMGSVVVPIVDLIANNVSFGG